MSALQLYSCSLLLTIAVTYIWESSIDPKEIVKMSKSEKISFILFLFMCTFTGITFVLAAFTGFKF